MAVSAESKHEMPSEPEVGIAGSAVGSLRVKAGLAQMLKGKQRILQFYYAIAGAIRQK